MERKRFFGRPSLALASSAVLLGAALVTFQACGTANDQGISFRALGFFEDGDAGEGELPAGDTGVLVPLSGSVNTVPFDRDEEPGLDGGFLGLQNNMAQGIRVERVDLSYRIVGSALQVPNDAFGLTVRLGPSTGTETSPPVSFSQILIASPQLFEFLNQNRSQLPETPFTMIVRAQAVGVADSGDVLITNPVSYEIVFVDDVETTPTPTESPSESP